MNTTLSQANNCCNTTESTTTSAHNAASNSKIASVRPRVNIYENDTAFLVDVEMPGVDEASAEIVLEKNLLTIKGTTQPTSREGYQKVYGFAGQYAYERSFQVPDSIDRDGLTASMKNGVLSVTLPKSAQLQPKKVAIKAG